MNTRFQQRARTVVLFTFAVLLPILPARAELPWRRPEISIKADNKSAADLLRALAVEQGISLQLNAAAATPISGDFKGLTALQFLDAICDASDLAWFWDGARLHIDAAQDIAPTLVTFEALTLEQASALIQTLGFESGPRTRQVALRGSGNLITLVGGARFLEITEPVLRALDSREKEKIAAAQITAAAQATAAQAERNTVQVRLFRLTHASASDINVRTGSTQSVIPGVARALQNIMGTPTGQLATGIISTDRKRQLSGLRGSGLAAVGATPPTDSTAAQPSAPSAAPSPEKAVIQADPRLNAVIVRDTAERMPLYESLIQQLDVTSPVIEISAAVVDIDADNGKTLGVEFLSFGKGKNDVVLRGGFEADRSFNEGNGANTGATPVFEDGNDLVRGAGALSSVLVPVSGTQLLTRIRALEEKGEAQLVTSPSVITLENVEAILRQDQTVFVRVAGREATDLFDVRTGVQLRVTPSLVREGDQLTFRLLVDVQDGSFSDLRVDDVPSTRESSINTQAMVPADRTLLIGGYFVDRHSKNTRQVPLLGNIPVFGRLFKRTENNHSRAQRYFFITPRLVDIHQESRQRVATAASAAPEKSPLPATYTDPAQSSARAHELATRVRPVAAQP